MLFSSYTFIFIFLPLVLAGYHVLGCKVGQRASIGWLVAASLVFYAWWKPVYLLLIVGSMAFNFALGLSLGRHRSGILLALGVGANLGLLVYFKYMGFFLENLASAGGLELDIKEVVLPLAISFFTFQQITYLVDACRGLTREYGLLNYCLFVTFFPQLIAGPIVHHREMLPQFADTGVFRLRSSHLAVGASVFIIGLAKKVLLADNLAHYSNRVFDAAAEGIQPTFVEAWWGALAYSFQLYFDFSGYSDMAIGAARMFGIILPVNFYSPYKATSIIDFWRRWHITLSRFLRDYLYIPMGGNRHGPVRWNLSLVVTMLLGGLWHGAGWTYILWGGLHGIMLLVNHAWIRVTSGSAGEILRQYSVYRPCSVALTFGAVVVSWILFRADSVEAAMRMYSAMFGFEGIALNDLFPNEVIRDKRKGITLLMLSFVIVWLLPNVLEVFRNYRPALNVEQLNVRKPIMLTAWKPSVLFAAAVSVLFVFSIISIPEGGDFLYFNF